MAAWRGFGAGEGEAEDAACCWGYDSTWEEEDEEEEEEREEEEEEEDGCGEEEGGSEPEAAEAAGGEEPVPSGTRGSRQAKPRWYTLWLKPLMFPFDTEEQRSNSSPLSQRGFQFAGRRNWDAAKDLQRYRHHYPGLIESENEEEEEMWNLSFYKNEICFLPRGLHIETLLESWWDNYEVLEENHSYIQW